MTAKDLLTSAIVLAMVAGPGSPSGAAGRQGLAQAQPNFSSESQLVVLHVAVRDKKGGYVAGLERAAFRILEDKKPQPISVFSSQDAPVTVGLLIDSSGSMAPNREMVIAASLAFARTSNPQDEMFVLGFNERINVPLPPNAPFARDLPTLHSALSRAITARGQTAIYDAVNAGLQYVGKGGFDRQVLVVVSDGGDNASAATRAQVLTSAQASNAVIYTIALVDPMDTEADPAFLKQLSEATGGEAFRPKNTSQVDAMLQRVASDIRNMYTLGYVPANAVSGMKDELRRVSVDANLPTGQKLQVRTRRAYLAGQAGGGGSIDVP